MRLATIRAESGGIRLDGNLSEHTADVKVLAYDKSTAD